jgi:hypothetical protein
MSIPPRPTSDNRTPLTAARRLASARLTNYCPIHQRYA